MDQSDYETKCPYCGNSQVVKITSESIKPPPTFPKPGLREVRLMWYQCLAENCRKWIVFYVELDYEPGDPSLRQKIAIWDQIKPIGTHKVLPHGIPPEVRSDFEEACEVLNISPKASAALSRRCLQSILRGYLKVKEDNLYNEIEEVLKDGSLSLTTATALHTVREIGNFAAHPEKSKITGMVIDIEPGEAEFNIDALELLIEEVFVRPTEFKKISDGVKAKRKEAK